MLQNPIVIAFSIAEVLLEYSNYFAEVGREGEGIADTGGTVHLNKYIYIYIRTDPIRLACSLVRAGKKFSLLLAIYRPQHTLQDFETYLCLRSKCAVLGLPLGTPLKSIQ